MQLEGRSLVSRYQPFLSSLNITQPQAVDYIMLEVEYTSKSCQGHIYHSDLKNRMPEAEYTST